MDLLLELVGLSGLVRRWEDSARALCPPELAIMQRKLWLSRPRLPKESLQSYLGIYE
jgi:hypothetical protein